MRSLILAVVFTGLMAAQQVFVRDLAQSEDNPVKREWFKPAEGCEGGVGGGGISGASHTPQPLSLAVLDVIPKRPRLGEVFDVEVQLTNSSKDAVEIPWSVSPSDVDRESKTPYGYREADLRLIIQWGEGSKTVYARAAVKLYGDMASHTMQRLAPGDKAKLRYKLIFSEMDGEAKTVLARGGSFPTSVVFAESRVTVTPQECVVNTHRSMDRSATAKIVLELIPSIEN